MYTVSYYQNLILASEEKFSSIQICKDWCQRELELCKHFNESDNMFEIHDSIGESCSYYLLIVKNGILKMFEREYDEAKTEYTRHSNYLPVNAY